MIGRLFVDKVEPIMKKISVIIPCYNVSPYLARLLDSLTAQTIGIENLELIFVNDASTDDTYEKLLEIEKKFPEDVLVVNLPENGRQGKARNIGLQYASCAYVGFIDADDYVETGMFQLLYENAIKYDCAMTGGLVTHPVGQTSVQMPNHLKTESLVSVADENDRMDLILNGNNGGIVSKIYKKQMLAAHGLWFPEGTSFEDNYWLPMVCLYIDTYYICDRIVYHYVDQPHSTVNQADLGSFDQRMNMEVQKLHGYIQRGFFKTYYPGIEALFCRSYYVDTLLGMYALRRDIPMEYYEKMRAEVAALFPGCMENRMLMEKDKKLLRTVFEPVTKERLEELLLEYARS